MRFFVRRFVIPLGIQHESNTDFREDYRGILARSGKNLDVKLLLSALQQSLEFEHYLERRFSQVVRSHFSKSDGRNENLWIQSVLREKRRL